MASFKKYQKGWRVQLCVRGIRVSKTFDTKAEATAWAKAQTSALHTEAASTGFTKSLPKKVITFLQLSKLKSESEIIAAATDIDDLAGIYFLVQGDRIIYVGQSANVYQRASAHRSSKDFDKIHIIQCPVEELRRLESLYIKRFNPELNRAGRSDLVAAPIEEAA